MHRLFIDNLADLSMGDFQKIFGYDATFQINDDQTITVWRNEAAQAILVCRLEDDQLPKVGRFALTAKQKAVLALLVTGLENREIGAKLGIGEKAVAKHVTAILKKTGLKRRSEVIGWYLTRKATPFET